MTSRTQVFLSYSHKDDRARQELELFLKPFQRELNLSFWSDRDIPAGDRWFEAIQEALASAKVAVLLVSANYLASNFIAAKEIPSILADQAKGGLRIIWVAYSASAYRITQIGGFQCANEPARPLDTLAKSERNRIWTAIAEKIHQAYTQDAPPDGTLPDQQAAEVEEVQPEDGRVVILYRREAKPDDALLSHLEKAIESYGFRVFIDQHISGGMRWAEKISAHIEKAAAVIPLLSAESVKSEMLAFEVQIACQAAQRQRGLPKVIPVRVRFSETLLAPFDLLDPVQQLSWTKEDDNSRLVSQIVSALRQPVRISCPRYVPPPGGALAPENCFYVERACDAGLVDAIQSRECLIHVRGPRQVGKSTVINRGVREARKLGYKTVRLDFQKFNEDQLADLPTLYRSIVDWFINELELDPAILSTWDPRNAPNVNLERVLRRGILRSVETHLFWAMDEVERLFGRSFAGEFFALIRSWYNDAKGDPDYSPWTKMTILISYASEAHQAITDLNQSPFNVGTELVLDDFTLEQVNNLNELYGAPLNNWQDLKSFYCMIEGQPYLTQRGLYDLQKGYVSLAKLQATAAREDGPFGDHLRRILVSLARNEDLAHDVRGVLNLKAGERPRLSEDSLFRLRRAGILVGGNPATAKLRCPVYSEYLNHALPEYVSANAASNHA